MDGISVVCIVDSFFEVELGLVRELFSRDYSWKYVEIFSKIRIYRYVVNLRVKD